MREPLRRCLPSFGGRNGIAEDSDCSESSQILNLQSRGSPQSEPAVMKQLAESDCVKPPTARKWIRQDTLSVDCWELPVHFGAANLQADIQRSSPADCQEDLHVDATAAVMQLALDKDGFLITTPGDSDRFYGSSIRTLDYPLDSMRTGQCAQVS